MPGFNLADYQPVEDRLREFWNRHPAGKVVTELVDHTDGTYIVKALVYRGDELREDRPAATGYAREVETERGVNSTSALENCETSAIGRALANLGFAPKGKRPSREEMRKASPPAATGTASTRPAAPMAAGSDEAGNVVPPEVTGEGEARPLPGVPEHEHVWVQSPKVSKWDICAFPDCPKTRKHETVAVS